MLGTVVPSAEAEISVLFEEKKWAPMCATNVSEHLAMSWKLCWAPGILGERYQLREKWTVPVLLIKSTQQLSLILEKNVSPRGILQLDILQLQCIGVT